MTPNKWRKFRGRFLVHANGNGNGREMDWPMQSNWHVSPVIRRLDAPQLAGYKL